MTGVKIINPRMQVSMPGLHLPRCLSALDQIPTIGRIRSQIERAKEEGIQKCIAQFGMGMDQPEEIRERCTIVHTLNSGVELLQIDGITRMEWGYLDPSAPHTWTIRTVEQAG